MRMPPKDRRRMPIYANIVFSQERPSFDKIIETLAAWIGSEIIVLDLERRTMPYKMRFVIEDARNLLHTGQKPFKEDVAYTGKFASPSFEENLPFSIFDDTIGFKRNNWNEYLTDAVILALLSIDGDLGFEARYPVSVIPEYAAFKWNDPRIPEEARLTPAI